MTTPLLDVRNLTVTFPAATGEVAAVNDMSFTLQPGRTLCLVGESGCGKSMTALSLLRLVPEPGRISAGSITFEGQNLLELDNDAMRSVRGHRIAMVFQEPMTSLNPVFRVGEQVAEALRLHLGMTKAGAIKRVIELFRLVGIPSPEQRVNDFPHQLSGGMRQRVMIAMALACEPRLLIADEPTTALDVTIQGQILHLLRQLATETGAAVLLITHDLGVVAETADDVAVMYAGRIVEQANVTQLFATPLHPYTQGLIHSAPQAHGRQNRLDAIPGTVPPLWALPEGCTFRDRCPHAFAKCSTPPPLMQQAQGHGVRCWLHEHA